MRGIEAAPAKHRRQPPPAVIDAADSGAAFEHGPEARGVAALHVGAQTVERCGKRALRGAAGGPGARVAARSSPRIGSPKAMKASAPRSSQKPYSRASGSTVQPGARSMRCAMPGLSPSGRSRTSPKRPCAVTQSARSDAERISAPVLQEIAPRRAGCRDRPRRRRCGRRCRIASASRRRWAHSSRRPAGSGPQRGCRRPHPTRPDGWNRRSPGPAPERSAFPRTRCAGHSCGA